METTQNQMEKAKRGAEDSGKYFRYMAEFIGFTAQDAEIIRRTKPYIAGRLPAIVSAFYTKLLRYPPTRKYFIRPDGSVDQDYLELRMRHLSNFWLRTAEGVFDDDYARYVDYVGRAHTSHGADPHIYIAERYVIGQVGFMQHAIGEVIRETLGHDPEFANSAEAAWDKLMMVLLELLARAYGNEREGEQFDPLLPVNAAPVGQLAEHAYDVELGLLQQGSFREVPIGRVEDIPEGERKLIELDGISIGIFHHKGQWIAIRNSCLHRGGPVATGCLEGDVITCPWHGFQYNLFTGELLTDPSAKLASYPVNVENGNLSILAPEVNAGQPYLFGEAQAPAASEAAPVPDLKENEFQLAELGPGKMRALKLNGQRLVVYNVDGGFYATQAECTHAGGPLEDGELDGCVVTCPWHFSRFNVGDGSVVEGPADKPLQTLKVVTEAGIGRIVLG